MGEAWATPPWARDVDSLVLIYMKRNETNENPRYPIMVVSKTNSSGVIHAGGY